MTCPLRPCHARREAQRINSGRPTLCSWEDAVRGEAPPKEEHPAWKALQQFMAPLRPALRPAAEGRSSGTAL